MRLIKQITTNHRIVHFRHGLLVNSATTLLEVLAITMALFTAPAKVQAQSSELFGFQLSGPGARPPTTSQGQASGTILYTAPDTLTLNITYSSLSSPLNQITIFFGFSELFHEGLWNGGITQFYAGLLPTSGTYSFTYTGSFIDQDKINSMNAGLTFLSISTQNYPAEDIGEIGGVVIVPEPLPLFLLAPGGVLLMIAFRWKTSGQKRWWRADILSKVR